MCITFIYLCGIKFSFTLGGVMLLNRIEGIGVLTSIGAAHNALVRKNIYVITHICTYCALEFRL